MSLNYFENCFLFPENRMPISRCNPAPQNHQTGDQKRSLGLGLILSLRMRYNNWMFVTHGKQKGGMSTLKINYFQEQGV